MGHSFKGAILRWRENPEVALLAWGFLLCTGILAFVKFASEVREGETTVFDEMILRSMRNPSDLADPAGPPGFAIAMLNLTALGSPAVLTLFTAMASAFLVIRRKIQEAAVLVISAGGGAMLTLLLKRFFDRPRPSVVPHLDIVTGASFPSGHTLLATIVYCTIGTICARLAPDSKTKAFVVSSALGLSFCVGFTRVYLGVHYPTDVLAGWAIGTLWAVLCWGFASCLRRQLDR